MDDIERIMRHQTTSHYDPNRIGPIRRLTVDLDTGILRIETMDGTVVEAEGVTHQDSLFRFDQRADIERDDYWVITPTPVVTTITVTGAFGCDQFMISRPEVIDIISTERKALPSQE